MSESLHEMAVRMSGGRCGKGCAGCPAHAAMYSVGGGCLIRRLAKIDNADEQILLLKMWAEEHPRKTWLDLLREKLPDSTYAADHNKIPNQCPHTLLGGKAPGGSIRCVTGSMLDLSCRECWNSEVKE